MTRPAPRRVRRILGAGLAIGLLASVSLVSTGALAKPAPKPASQTSAGTSSVSPRVHLHGRTYGGVLPNLRAARTRAKVTPNGTPPLIYHGGPIQTASKVYTLF